MKPIGEAAEYISNQLGVNSKNVKNQSVIIIDDLERLSTDKISYSDLLDYLNGLMACNCRIICIMNSKAIINSSNSEENGFKDFYEKVFDEIRIIDAVTKDTYDAIFRNNDANKDYDIPPIWYRLFKPNLRIAQRTYLNYKKVLKHIEDKDKYVNYEEKMTKEDLFKLCYYSTYMAFKYLFDTKTEKEKKDDREIEERLKEESKEFSALNDLYWSSSDAIDRLNFAVDKLCKESDFTADKNRLDFRFHVYAFASFLFENNAYGIDSIFKKVDSKTPPILNKDIFYLSEKNKEKYCVAFVEMINNGDFTFDDSFFNKIKDIMDCYSSFTFDDETINKIVEKMVEEKTDKRKVRDYIEMSEDGDEKRCYEFMIQLQERYLQKFDESVRAQLKVFIDKDDYGSATDLLAEYFDNQGNGKSKLIDEIIEHDFYFPDLGDDITSSSWSYCHKIVEIMSKYGKREFFDSFADKQLNEHSDDSTLVGRYTYLKKYILKRLDL